MTPKSEFPGCPNGPSTNTSSSQKPPKTHNSGRWTNPQFVKFVIRCLRRAKWPVKYEALEQAFAGTEINPKTGKKRKTYRCACCNQTFGSKDVQVDHIVPVRAGGGKDWEGIIERMFCELDGFQVLCVDCHETKSVMENANVDRSVVPMIKAIAAFRKRKAVEQIATLASLGLPNGSNASERMTIYAEWARINLVK